MIEKLTAQQVCDSKTKHTLISAEFSVNNGDKGLSQSFYLCKICNTYHVTTNNKSVEKKRKNKFLNKYDNETYKAIRNKKNKKAFRSKKKR